MPTNLKWTAEQAKTWYDGRAWACGFNYVTSSAVNSTEMWQAATFDEESIERELGWARKLGFSACRVFLQYLVWEAEGAAFLETFERFLDIAGAKGLSVMPILFDDCAFSGKQPYLGLQDAPVSGVHNSGWTPSPGHARVVDPGAWPRLEQYATQLATRFGQDERIYLWDVYNEPGNSNLGNDSLPLLHAAFAWLRAAAPCQPLTVGTWSAGLPDLNQASLELSDIVSFHSYEDLSKLKLQVQALREQAAGRPLICTEWMARTFNSLFATHLPFFREQGIACFNWGLVRGKTQTHFPWGSPEGATEPEPWFHDILQPDGTPYREEEVAVIRAVTEGKPQRSHQPSHA